MTQAVNVSAVLHGLFNRRDRRDRPIPWTARSLAELIVLCLAAMGEARYTLRDVPDTRPPIEWDGVPAAEALQSLCDLHGLRCAYCADLDGLLICPRDHLTRA